MESKNFVDEKKHDVAEKSSILFDNYKKFSENFNIEYKVLSAFDQGLIKMFENTRRQIGIILYLLKKII